MVHFTCDLCGKDLTASGDPRYVVKIEAYAGFDPTEITGADLDDDHMEAISEILSRDGGGRAPDASSIPASGRAKAAIAYALAQVGDSYVYGAAGPNAFDCSGLTMMAWGQAGVSLPHSSRAQMGSGAPVSKSQLQPGDLVFYYSPVSHVGMYIGNGMIVHAANPGAGVKVSSVDEMPYAGAVRPG